MNGKKGKCKCFKKCCATILSKIVNHASPRNSNKPSKMVQTIKYTFRVLIILQVQVDRYCLGPNIKLERCPTGTTSKACQSWQGTSPSPPSSASSSWRLLPIVQSRT